MPVVQPTADDAANPISPPSPRSALFFDGTDWRVARVDAAGHLQIDVLSTAMDPLAATEATLASADAYLGLIAVLWNCLRTVGTDRFMVKGEDQLFSFKGVLALTNDDTVSGAGGYIDSAPVPAGEIWVVTTAIGVDWTTATTAHFYYNRHDGVNHMFNVEQGALAVGDYTKWSGHIYLDVDDVVRVTFIGSLVGDSVAVRINGYRMTVET